jgi:alpha-tubulin suppressor-like RCC1 family protein
LYIWGSGSFGELLKPKKYVLSIAIRDVAIRGFFGVAIGHTSKNENRIYCWGNNTFGELGLGSY